MQLGQLQFWVEVRPTQKATAFSQRRWLLLFEFDQPPDTVPDPKGPSTGPVKATADAARHVPTTNTNPTHTTLNTNTNSTLTTPPNSNTNNTNKQRNKTQRGAQRRKTTTKPNTKTGKNVFESLNITLLLKSTLNASSMLGKPCW